MKKFLKYYFFASFVVGVVGIGIYYIKYYSFGGYEREQYYIKQIDTKDLVIQANNKIGRFFVHDFSKVQRIIRHSQSSDGWSTLELKIAVITSVQPGVEQMGRVFLEKSSNENWRIVHFYVERKQIF